MPVAARDMRIFGDHRLLEAISRHLGVDSIVARSIEEQTDAHDDTAHFKGLAVSRPEGFVGINHNVTACRVQLRIRLLKSINTVDLKQLAQPQGGVKNIAIVQTDPTCSMESGLVDYLNVLQNSLLHAQSAYFAAGLLALASFNRQRRQADGYR